MNEEELKQGFISYFGEEAWENEEGLGKLVKPQLELCDYLGIEPWPIITEDIPEDSRIYFDKQYIALNPKSAKDYLEGLKAIIHEERHVYQLFCVREENHSEPLLPVFKEDFSKFKDLKEDGSTSYYETPIEIDAFAFTKYYLNNVLHISYNYPDKEYDKLLDEFIRLFYLGGYKEWKEK